MTSPEREQPPSHRILVGSHSSKDRLDLERKILAASFKFSFESGDSDGAALAHKGLCGIIQQQLFSGDGSSGSVIPASVWQNAQVLEAADEAISVAPTGPMGSSGTGAQASGADGGPEAAPAAGGGLDASVPEGIISGTQARLAPSQLDANAQKPVSDPEIPGAGSAEGLPASEDLRKEIPVLSEAELEDLRHADPTAPLSYLDFGAQDESEAQPLPPEPEPVPSPAAVPMTPSQLIKTQSFYQILGVSQVASFEDIHMRYRRRMLKLLRSRYSSENCITDLREFREVLRAVCVAHDVLKDPVTRADYDLRQVGLRSDLEAAAGIPPQRTGLRIGELLECAQILQPAELQVALDMHKAEPGVQFGEFLVVAGFLSQEELDCVLLAQKLISRGKITVNQFRSAMYEMRDKGVPFFDTLMTEGWLAASDILNPNSDLWATLNEPYNGAAPVAVAAASSEQSNGKPEDSNGHAERPASVSASISGFGEKWTEKDAMAETQAIDVAAFRAQLKTISEDAD